MAQLGVRVAAPGETVTRLALSAGRRDDKSLIAPADDLLYLELLESEHSLGQRILDHGATAAMKTVSGDLAPFLVGKRGCYDRFGEVLLDWRHTALVRHVATSALRVARQVDHFGPNAPALTFFH